MALAATATEILGQWAVKLTATGATGTVTWYRDISGRQQTTIGTGTSLVDRFVPLNTPATWVAVDSVDSVVTATLTVESGFPVITSSTTGIGYQVTVIAQQPESWSARSVWHPVLDRSNGPVVSIFEAEWRSGTLLLDLPDRAIRSNMIGMLFRGDPLILRATCPDRVDDLTILPTQWSDPYMVDGAWSSGQRLEITYQSVTNDPPAYQAPPPWTYQDVFAAHPTYQDAFDSYDTYEDLLVGAP